MAESKVPTFTSLKREDWSGYLTRLNLHFKYRKVEDDALKHAAFVSNMGDIFYKLADRIMVQNLSKTVAECTYGEITELLTKYFKPTENVNTCKNLFFHREKKSTETVDEYADALTELAHKCNFTAELRKEILRDRFLTGLNNEKMQTILFAIDPTPEFDVLLAKARIQEHILVDVSEVQKASVDKVDKMDNGNGNSVNLVSKFTSGKINKLGNRPNKWNNSNEKQGCSSEESSKCFRCTKGGHSPDDCWFKTKRCLFCEKKGHTIRACKLKEKSIKHLSNESEESDSDQCLNVKEGEGGILPEYCFKVSANVNPNRPILMHVTLNGNLVELELDTGSCHTLINSKEFVTIFEKNQPKLENCSDVVLFDFNGKDITVMGKTSLCVEFEGKSKMLTALITVKGHSVIGRDWLYYLKPELFSSECEEAMYKISNVNSVSEVCILQESSSSIGDFIMPTNMDSNLQCGNYLTVPGANSDPGGEISSANSFGFPNSSDSGCGEGIEFNGCDFVTKREGKLNSKLIGIKGNNGRKWNKVKRGRGIFCKKKFLGNLGLKRVFLILCLCLLIVLSGSFAWKLWSVDNTARMLDLDGRLHCVDGCHMSSMLGGYRKFPT